VSGVSAQQVIDEWRPGSSEWSGAGSAREGVQERCEIGDISLRDGTRVRLKVGSTRLKPEEVAPAYWSAWLVLSPPLGS
jgi:hypothetical protein